MKQFLTKISSLSLAFLVLLSTFSFTVDKHFCGDFLVDVSITGKSDNCGMKMDKVSSTKKKNCCKDEVQKIEGQDELQINKVENITFENQQFLISFINSYQILFINFDEELDFYKDFSPPDIPLDYQVQYQSFLI
ncbi:MAG: hypothetical protein WAO74_09280 [Polaribacter sp.]|uniref:HYC_CC_PP family protein n=1 Tax=Polaribacter sp. TaxID=1920175 RepID=UPI003BAE2167